MVHRATILILTSQTGGGHVSLAQALRERLEHDYSIEILDPQPRFFNSHYRFVSRHANWIWLTEFKVLNSRRTAALAHRVFAPVVARELQAGLDRVRPQLVITTYPFLTDEVTAVLRRQSRRIPFALHFADAGTLHATWLTDRDAAAAFAPTRETYEQALTAGIPADRLWLTGWPVREQFHPAAEWNREEVLVRLGLDPRRFTVFLQAGGDGVGRLASTVHETLAAHESVQIILAAGTNGRLVRRFENTPRVHVFPFNSHIAPYMHAADVVMGKAGPNTLFEAVMLCKPFIATTYIPGQETPNLEFIQRHGLGWVALSPRHQRALVEALATTPSMITTMAATVEGYQRWNIEATGNFVPLIDALLSS